jgi:uncharacterized protein (DUF934 family)
MNTRTINIVNPEQDRWTLAPADEAVTPAAYLLLSWAQWRDSRDTWPQDLPVGAILPNDGDLQQLVPDLARLSLVALPFPKWTDGRAYSLARTLSVRHRYAGELRAIGDVIPDMAAQLQRTGFTAAVLRSGQSAEVALRMLNFFDEYYQGDVQERRIRFARPSAGAAR